MNLEDVFKRLMANKDEKFFVNTSVKVLSVDKNVKEGGTWRLGQINAGNIEYSEEVKLNITIFSLSHLKMNLFKVTSIF